MNNHLYFNLRSPSSSPSRSPSPEREMNNTHLTSTEIKQLILLILLYFIYKYIFNN